VSGSDPARGHAYVGCSGWSYKHWRGTIYDPALKTTEWFGAYARRFSTVEVNNTFYRLPEATTFDNWRAQAPPGFVFALKVSQFGTHRMKLRDPARWLPTYVERALHLGKALGPNLVQLPPRWKRDAARLEEFLEFATSQRFGPQRPGSQLVGAPLRWAVEFRDPSWLDQEIYELLRRFGVVLCVHDLLPDHPWLLTADWAYSRFHGPAAASEKYEGEYGPERLSGPARALSNWRDQGCDVFAYFNNDAGGAAVRDATWLEERLTSG
jgi:uncharacterized protein YecE (DUF72 family)